METKECENTYTRRRRDNAGKAIEHLEMNFAGKTYYTQFATSTDDKKIYFMHDMHKLTVDVTFTLMIYKNGITKHGERAVEAMYK